MPSWFWVSVWCFSVNMTGYEIMKHTWCFSVCTQNRKQKCFGSYSTVPQSGSVLPSLTTGGSFFFFFLNYQSFISPLLNLLWKKNCTELLQPSELLLRYWKLCCCVCCRYIRLFFPVWMDFTAGCHVFLSVLVLTCQLWRCQDCCSEEDGGVFPFPQAHDA